MRVISGSAKGRQLKAVEGRNTRPTTDKVKEALFSIISPYIDGGYVLDLFAGTGGLGIEALSRGMNKAIFVDYDRSSFEVIKKNIEICGFTQQAEVYKNDAERALKALIKRDIRFAMVFLDPPYKYANTAKLINFISENLLVNQSGIIVVEHDVKMELPDKIGTFIMIKKSEYGITGVSIYQNEQKRVV